MTQHLHLSREQRVKHRTFGIGRIESMDLRGSTRVMSIEFATSGRRTVTSNLQTMTVVEDTMTTIIPELTDAQLAELPSQAEAGHHRVPGRGCLWWTLLVFFQAGWILPRGRASERWRNGTSSSATRSRYVCVGSGGGRRCRVRFQQRGLVFRRDGHRHKHAINNPVSQALPSIRSAPS